MLQITTKTTKTTKNPKAKISAKNAPKTSPDTVSHAKRKAAQRAEKRAAGYKEVSVWVRPDKVDAVRQFADSLPKPAPPIDNALTPSFDFGETDG